ncbi:hypothetical protein HRG_011223 [Hirsutella rhossiliensis]|uniref:Chromo domain-containing protein n=1 Tax=Hirsutella rhossiliensis TaxID=111463 RepID=A0A9P8MR68_9HYPO|nr:uncharacterized protein HRG_11223 [Hirsutella rhossiliensis]KAH0957732.1 hypothetical protein HRG_11223 [Hirsutella rhossiliensis]
MTKTGTSTQRTILREPQDWDKWVKELKAHSARWKKRGRGEFRQALVRWTGYAEPTWEPLEWLQGTIAMKAFEDKYGPIKTNDGPRERYETLAGKQEPRRRRPAWWTRLYRVRWVVLGWQHRPRSADPEAARTFCESREDESKSGHRSG